MRVYARAPPRLPCSVVKLVPQRRGAKVAALALLAACRSEHREPPGPNVGPSAAPSVSAASPTESAMRARIASLGRVHGAPLRVPGVAGGDDRWLVLVGDESEARAAWIASPKDAKPIDDFPFGVRLLDAHVAGDRAELRVETRSFLDQPAGLRAIVAVDLAQARVVPAVMPELARGAAALVARDAAAPKSASREALVKAVEKLDAALASAHAEARVFRVWQGRFVEARGPFADLDAKGRADVHAFLTAHQGAWKCADTMCEASDGTVVFDPSTTPPRASALVLRPAPPPARGAGVGEARRSVASSTSHAALPWLRERAGATAEELGEAPLATAGGTIAVGTTPPEPGARGASTVAYLTVVEGGSGRVFPLRAFAPEEKAEVRFLDFDGDGRTDVLFRTTFLEDGVERASTLAFRAPHPSIEDEGAREPALALYAMAPSLDDAVRAILASETRGVDPVDACQLALRAKSPAGLRGAAVADARVITFNEPGDPSERPASVRASDATAEALRGFVGCPLVCDKDRPFCRYLPKDEADKPYMEYFWFTWASGHARLAGLARYTGS